MLVTLRNSVAGQRARSFLHMNVMCVPVRQLSRGVSGQELQCKQNVSLSSSGTHKHNTPKTLSSILSRNVHSTAGSAQSQGRAPIKAVRRKATLIAHPQYNYFGPFEPVFTPTVDSNAFASLVGLIVDVNGTAATTGISIQLSQRADEEAPSNTSQCASLIEKNLLCFGVKHSGNSFRGVLPFRIVNGGSSNNALLLPIVAMGQSTRKRHAPLLCCLHAIKIITYYTRRDCANEAFLSFEGKRGLTFHVRCLLPLEERKLTVTASQRTALPTDKRSSLPSPSRTSPPAPPPQPSDYNAHDSGAGWVEYFRDCQEYVSRNLICFAGDVSNCTKYFYSQQRNAPTGNVDIDTASELLYYFHYKKACELRSRDTPNRYHLLLSAEVRQILSNSPQFARKKLASVLLHDNSMVSNASADAATAGIADIRFQTMPLHKYVRKESQALGQSTRYSGTSLFISLLYLGRDDSTNGEGRLLVACGIGTSSGVAESRCSHHALLLLQLRSENHADRESPLLGTGALHKRSAHCEVGNSDSVFCNDDKNSFIHSNMFQLILLNLLPANRNIVDLYLLLFKQQLRDGDVDLPYFSFERKIQQQSTSDPGQPQSSQTTKSVTFFTCTIAWLDLECTECSCVGYYEAARTCFDNLLLLLGTCNERIQFVISVMNSYQHLLFCSRSAGAYQARPQNGEMEDNAMLVSPLSIPSASISNDVIELVEALLKRNASVIPPHYYSNEAGTPDMLPREDAVVFHEFDREIQELTRASVRQTERNVSFDTDVATARERLRRRLHSIKDAPSDLNAALEHYRTVIFPQQASLPIHSKKQEILETLRANDVIIVNGSTGCGKTTQIPQFILDEYLCSHDGTAAAAAAMTTASDERLNIIVTQPRRITTISVAERVANERLQSIYRGSSSAGVSDTNEVGYIIRLDNKVGKFINFMTTGILLQILSSANSDKGDSGSESGNYNDFLGNFTHLIIDEIHERDVNTDVTLALIKDILIRQKHSLSRPKHKLKVILMSATMQPDIFANYFQEANVTVVNGAEATQSAVPIIDVEGRVFPVTEHYLEDMARNLNVPFKMNLTGFQRHYYPFRYRDPRSGDSYRLLIPPRIDYRLIAFLVHRSVFTDLGVLGSSDSKCSRSILVFLPGWKELQLAKQAVEESFFAEFPVFQRNVSFKIILLHSSVDMVKQREAFESTAGGSRGSGSGSGGCVVKVILATNIAESGITINDASVVIDSGLIKQSYWNSNSLTIQSGGEEAKKNDKCSNAAVGDNEAGDDVDDESDNNTGSSGAVFSTQLLLQYESASNSKQRRGRAGRTQPGTYYCCIPKRLFRGSASGGDSSIADDVNGGILDFSIAEIHRVPLTQVILQLLQLGHTNIEAVLGNFLEKPPTENVRSSLKLLSDLGAIKNVSSSASSANSSGTHFTLTSLGHYMSKLPCDPRVSKLIVLGVVFNALDTCLTIAACFDISPFITTRETEKLKLIRERKCKIFAKNSESDEITNVNAYNAFVLQSTANPAGCGGYFAQHNYLHRNNMYLISRYKKQYHEILQRSGIITMPRENRSFANRAALFVDTSAYSSNSSDVFLVKAIIASSLYPNVAIEIDEASEPAALRLKRLRRLKTKNTLVFKVKAYAHISASKDSVCRKRNPVEPGGSSDAVEQLWRGEKAKSPTSSAAAPTSRRNSSFYVFKEIFTVTEAKKSFLTDVSNCSIFAILLLGGESSSIHHLSYTGEGASCYVPLYVLDDWTLLMVGKETAALIKKLKHIMTHCITEKYRNPTNQQNNQLLDVLRTVFRYILSQNTSEADGDENGSIISPHSGTQDKRSFLLTDDVHLPAAEPDVFRSIFDDESAQ